MSFAAPSDAEPALASSHQFSPKTVHILRRFDRRIRGCAPGDVHALYAACRRALSVLAQVDTFYVAHYCGESTIAMPYTFDHDVHLPSDVSAYRPDGLSNWIRVSRRTYRFRDDGGVLIARGQPCGDEHERSLDAVVTPLIDPDGSATGFLAILSTSADSYDDEVVRAAEWLSRRLVRALARQAEDAQDDDYYELYPELDPARPSDGADLVAEVSERLDGIIAAARTLQDTLSAAGHEQWTQARGLAELCERHEAELVPILIQAHPAGQPSAPAHDPLTPREEEVVQLVREHLSNAEIAARLHISAKTVKTHLSHVFRKLGVTQRSALHWVGLEPTPDPATSTAAQPGS